jgi:hypothetical protein
MILSIVLNFYFSYSSYYQLLAHQGESPSAFIQVQTAHATRAADI